MEQEYDPQKRKDRQANAESTKGESKMPPPLTYDGTMATLDNSKNPLTHSIEKDNKWYDTSYQVFNGSLFVTDQGIDKSNQSEDLSAISMNDVKQGYLWDCYFMAAVAALAKNDPAAIKKLIKDNGNGTYDVTLYVNPMGGREKHVETVSTDFPVTDDGKHIFARLGDKNEIWVMLLEKAYAQYMGSYEALGSNKWPSLGEQFGFDDKKGDASNSLEILTNKSATTVYLSPSLDQKTIIDSLHYHVSNDVPTVASTGKKALKDHNILEKHSYVLDKVDTKKQTIDLYNPGGKKHIKKLPIDLFLEYFIKVDFLDLE